MKKFLVCLILGFFVFAIPAFAGVKKVTIIAETALDDDPTSITGTWNISDFKRAGVFISYEESETEGSLSVNVTVDYSYDNVTFVAGYFYDFASATTPVNSESLSSDIWYYLWVDTAWTMPNMRVTLTAIGSDADDIATVSAYLVGLK